MTAWDSTTTPTKDVRYRHDTRSYEVSVNGYIIGYAPTMIRGYELANEYVYQQLTRDHLDPADLPQDDAEAILFVQMPPVQASGELTVPIPAINIMVSRLSEEEQAAFWKLVEETDHCWIWRGTLSNRWNGSYKGQLAHRVSYTLTYGPIPPGLMVCHHCDHPPCVRPDHLFLGTAKDNKRDYAVKGKKNTPPNKRDTLLLRVRHLLGAKQWRNKCWSSERTLQRESGLDPYTFYGILSGHIKVLTPDVLAILCRYLECSEEDLLGPATTQ